MYVIQTSGRTAVIPYTGLFNQACKDDVMKFQRKPSRVETLITGSSESQPEADARSSSQRLETIRCHVSGGRGSNAFLFSLALVSALRSVIRFIAARGPSCFTGHDTE